MIGIAWIQAILDGIGAVLAWLYDLIPNYGVAIILLTLLIRVLLLPIAVKTMRSQQKMQAMAPKVQEIKRKYKGDRQRIQAETARLYKEEGVNPLGCLPLFLQFPVLIMLFYVLQFPQGMTHIPHSDANPVVGQPQDSRLYVAIRNQDTDFLGMNLVCSPAQAGTQVTVKVTGGPRVPDAPRRLDCGSGGTAKIPYYLLLGALAGTSYYQIKQMRHSSPPGSRQQQQMMGLFLPVITVVFGYTFPAGLPLYWLVQNGVQILQQHFMLPRPAEVAPGPSKARGDGGKGVRRDKPGGINRSSGKPGTKGLAPGDRQVRPQAGADGGSEGGKPQPKEGQGRRSTGAGPGSQGNRGRGPGGRSGGDRKKRRKR